MPGNEIIEKEEFAELKKIFTKVMVCYLRMLLIKEEKNI